MRRGDEVIQYRQAHFIGIGGYGMSALARVLLAKGVKVSGSDLTRKDLIDKLEQLGARVYIGHRKEQVNGADVVVYSSDIPQDNVELAEAVRRQIPLLHRSQMLAQILNGQTGIAVAGTHGKTTTTSMIARILELCGLDPTYIIGGELLDVGSNAKAGKSPYVVAEADESDGTFLQYEPFVAVVTNLEADHLENYDNDFSKLVDAYRQFLGRIKPGGLAVLNVDDPHLRSFIPSMGCRVMTYSMRDSEADLYAADVRTHGLGCTYRAVFRGNDWGEVTLSVPGRHNVANSLAALLVGQELGLAFPDMAAALSSFHGAKRRFEIIADVDDILVVDDYAHHPTEIAATLEAARGLNRRVVALFQPHRYSRTDDLKEQFASAFDKADEVWITDIYSPKGDQRRPISGQQLVDLIRQKSNPNTHFAPNLQALVQQVRPRLAPGDLVLTMGAGDIWQVSRWLRDELLANKQMKR
ncbi:MAG: UDP-N-acetylmuramate--L-alanine ligase [Bacillota bacterium]